MSKDHLKNQLSELFSGIEPQEPDVALGDEVSADPVAEPAQRVIGSTELSSLVTFKLGNQTFALPIEPIVQIVEMVTVTPIPQAIYSLQGVINVRGVAVPLINLRRHFGLDQSSAPIDSHIVLVQYGEQMIGLIVDQVLSVLDLTDGRLTQTIDMIPRELGELPLLQGLLLGKGETVLLLDLAHLLLPQHRMALAQAVMAAEEEEE